VQARRVKEWRPCTVDGKKELSDAVRGLRTNGMTNLRASSESRTRNLLVPRLLPADQETMVTPTSRISLQVTGSRSA
jgi:hypothetical protein